MPKSYVHDFSFDYIELENRVREDDFFCGVRVHFNFSPDDPGDGWDNLEYFSISVATPFGLANYIKRCTDKGLYSKKVFFPNVLIVDSSNEEEIMDFIKSELNSIYGKTENELILKAIRKFGWESENIPEVYVKLFIIIIHHKMPGTGIIRSNPHLIPVPTLLRLWDEVRFAVIDKIPYVAHYTLDGTLVKYRLCLLSNKTLTMAGLASSAIQAHPSFLHLRASLTN